MPDQLDAETTLDVNLHFLSAVCDLKNKKKKRVYFRRLILLRVYSNRFLRNHTGKVVPHVFPSCWKLSRFRPSPTWCVSRRGLKTIWGNFQTAASDSYFWKKRNDWVSYKTTTTNLNRNHMAYPTLFHTVAKLCLVYIYIYIYIYIYHFFIFSPNKNNNRSYFLLGKIFFGSGEFICSVDFIHIEFFTRNI